MVPVTVSSLIRQMVSCLGLMVVSVAAIGRFHPLADSDITNLQGIRGREVKSNPSPLPAKLPYLSIGYWIPLIDRINDRDFLLARIE